MSSVGCENLECEINRVKIKSDNNILLLKLYQVFDWPNQGNFLFE